MTRRPRLQYVVRSPTKCNGNENGRKHLKYNIDYFILLFIPDRVL